MYKKIHPPSQHDRQRLMCCRGLKVVVARYWVSAAKAKGRKLRAKPRNTVPYLVVSESSSTVKEYKSAMRSCGLSSPSDTRLYVLLHTGGGLSYSGGGDHRLLGFWAEYRLLVTYRSREEVIQTKRISGGFGNGGGQSFHRSFIRDPCP